MGGTRITDLHGTRITRITDSDGTRITDLHGTQITRITDFDGTRITRLDTLLQVALSA